MLLDEAHDSLGWPARKQVLHPEGAGARVFADFARQKIGEALRRKFPGLQVITGILAADPYSNSTEAPLAIVCEFPSGAGDKELEEAHRLAWNFSRTALLLTLEPHRLIAWSCCQAPNEPLEKRQVRELTRGQASGVKGTAQQRAVHDLLHWVGLITGQLLREEPKRFPADGRADALLLKNLRAVRQQLLGKDGEDLPQHYCHDLLARIIFTQFLFHRKGSDGKPFFDERLLEGRCEGRLRKVHQGLSTILEDKDETYALFRWLDDKFNGDLFPGKENQSEQERERAWQEEKDAVDEDRHLRLLADLVSGRLDVGNQQLNLWPQYSFDVIPLEFISSVYEEFLTGEKKIDKAYYTPAHLVDFVLDAVLPWKGTEWDLKILDPSCGSGIFLVKAFQRLIYRWRQVVGEEPLVSHLKPILANNLFGVDKNPEAVRVACFSLYLAMADAIEPKHYLKREKVFPRLRGTRLFHKDFFDEETPGFRTQEDAERFDLVLGNAPWGDQSILKTSDPQIALTRSGSRGRAAGRRQKKVLTKAEQWAEDAKHPWPVANNDIGPLFLAKSAELIHEGGRVAMIQPASLLNNREPPARDFRKKLFLDYTVDEVSNLSALRRELFSGAVGSACVIVFGKQKPTPQQTLLYICPKPLRDRQSGHRFVIEPQDVNRLTHEEAAIEPVVWSALAIGGRRDLALVRRFSQLSTLSKLEEKGEVLTRLGVIPGNKKKILDGSQDLPDLREKSYFDEERFPDDVFLELDAGKVPVWKAPAIADSDSTNFEAFKLPQLLIKLSFSVKDGRFRAALVRSSDKEWGLICKKTYVSVRDYSHDGRHIKTACLAYNSSLATYYLYMTSSRLWHYITEPLKDELLEVPLPPLVKSLKGLDSFAAIDSEVKSAFKDLTPADWVLVEDFLASIVRKEPGRTLRKEPNKTPGYEPTRRIAAKSEEEPELESYARHFVRVVKSTFGKVGNICATVFREPPNSPLLPVRMVAIHLDWPGRDAVTPEEMEAHGLMEKLQKLYANAMERKARAHAGSGLGFQRVVFLFQAHQEAVGRVQSLYIIKPDQRRYWTRSLAFRDADQLSGAILKAAGRSRSAS
jgi:type I restriction-modification system DNA methylase subunit